MVARKVKEQKKLPFQAVQMLRLLKEPLFGNHKNLERNSWSITIKGKKKQKVSHTMERVKSR